VADAVKRRGPYDGLIGFSQVRVRVRVRV